MPQWKKRYAKHGFCVFRKNGKKWIPVEGVADSVETILCLNCSPDQVSLLKKDYVGYYIDCDNFNKVYRRK